LLRYAFDGSAWGTPTQFSVAGLLQVHLSPDGTHLLALVMPDNADTSMVELDPVTLAQTKVTTASNPTVPVSANACGFAIGNDGNAIVDFAFGDNAFAFGASSRVFTPMSTGGACDPVASGNGAVVALSGMNYLASSETFSQPGAQTDSEATGDFVGDKFVYSGSVEDGAGEFLGYTPGLFGQVINSPGTRIYGSRPDPTTSDPTLVTYDLTAPPSGNPPLFPELGTPIALPNNCSPFGCTGGFSAIATTPDGSVIFIASPDGVIVQPIS
jgi:hypothetical protein